jgi:hypothetical protein
MNSKKIAYILVTFSFIFIISGGVSSFLIGLKDDRVATLKRIDEVKDEFEVFSTNTSVFESFRDELYNNVFSNIYYETMHVNDVAVKNKLSNYENLVDELTKNTNNMNKLCDDMYYPDSEINNKCNNYKSIYEQVINYFVSDIAVYNSHIDKYNQFQASINSNLKLDYYKTDKDYIDYNKDKKFDGKEE